MFAYMNTEYRKIISSAEDYYHKNKLLINKISLPCAAVIDTGIFPHKNLTGRILDFFDPINHRITPYDDNGHGTHISGIISGFDYAMNGKYHGIFPQCPLIGVKALTENGNGKVPDFIHGLQYLIDYRHKYNIRTINISLGAEFDHSKEQLALIDCVEHAWDLGIVVCAAAGNNGPEHGSITIPGISKKILTIGTSDDSIPIRITAGKKRIHYSGRGPTDDCILKPDILCPGSNILSLSNQWNGYVRKSGTSMSTPMICGAVCLVLSVHPDLTPKEIKKAVKAAHFPNSLQFDSNLFFSFF